MSTLSTTSALIGLVGAPWPEHLHWPRGAEWPRPLMHSGGSLHGGSNDAPKLGQPQSVPPRAGARGNGTLRLVQQTGGQARGIRLLAYSRSTYSLTHSPHRPWGQRANTRLPPERRCVEEGLVIGMVRTQTEDLSSLDEIACRRLAHLLPADAAPPQ